jgi:RNA polymerase sigma-70 factor (ECF subfamily)
VDVENDDELVRRCLDGDESAALRFVRNYERLIFGVCLRMVRDRHEAEDLTQEVFVRAIRSLKSWDRRRPIKPWLVTIAANRCRTALSRRKRIPKPSSLEFDIEQRREKVDDSAELRQELASALGDLRDDYQQAFLLFHEQRLSYEQISELTGKPIGTLKTWLFRARAILLKRLEAKGMIAKDERSPT